MVKTIKNNLYYIGVLDRSLQVFDVMMETKYGTSYNAYLVKTQNHVVLIETVKVAFFEEYINQIKQLVNIDKIDYIIVNHTEPDHVGSLEKLLSLNPDLMVMGSKAAITYLHDIMNKEFKSEIVKHNQEITIDEKIFQFISAPFLHWPDSIYTYIKEDEVLFTCDSFGAHYIYKELFISKLPTSDNISYLEAFKYYYDSIFSPYKKFVLQALEKIKDLPINIICTGHGPILDTNIQFYLDSYREWSEEKKTYDKLIVVPYASSYGYTEQIAMKIKEGIQSFDSSIEVQLYNLNVTNYETLREEIETKINYSDAVLFGSTTINKDATPIMWYLAIYMNSAHHQGKYVSTFGSYGWSGEGVDNIQSRLKNLNLKVLPSCKLKFKPSLENEAVLENYGKELAQAIYQNKNQITLINDGKIKINN